MAKRRVVRPLLLCLVTAIAACSSGKSPAASSGVKGSITVLAASSLTKGFTALGAEFEAENPGTKISFSFGASSDLVTQIGQGAPADVFASADQKNMDKVVAAHEAGGAPTDFAKNKLTIAVERGNPKRIATLTDLAKSDLIVVLCDAAVPCGKFADQVLANAKVSVTPKSREASAKATLSRVEVGEADAAIVYVSDVKSSGKVDGVAIPDDVNVVTTLPIVALKQSTNPTVARAWLEFVVRHAGELVNQYGFLPL